MTQLSLFDLPSATTADSAAPSVVAVPSANYSVAAPAAKTQTRSTRRRHRKGSETTSHDKIEGVQRMGDLARFVIMRYELAVKYREDMEARRHQSTK